MAEVGHECALFRMFNGGEFPAANEARPRGTVADCYLPDADHQRAYLDGNGPVAKGVARDRVGKEMSMLPLVLSSDSHVFEPPDLWQARIDRAFRDRAPRIERISGGDYVVVETDQILSGIGLISNAGARFEAPETISPDGRLGLAGAMITEYPAEDRRYDQTEYEPFWAAAAALDMPLSLHTATRRQGKIRGAGPGTLRDASSRATKAFYPALSMCDMIFSGVFERHPRLTLAIVEFELSWAPNVVISMDYTYRERHREAIYRFKDGMLPSDFFRRNVVLSFQEDAIG